MDKGHSTFAERLVGARLAAGFGQEVVAKAAGMSQSSYSDLETGKSKGTTRLGSLARALDVDAYWLETGSGEKHSHGVAEPRAEYLPADRRRLLELFDGMSDRKRKALLQLLDN